MDSGKYDITVKHILTMRMGVQDDSENNFELYWNHMLLTIWIRNAIDLPLAYGTGERMRYNTFELISFQELLPRLPAKARWLCERKLRINQVN